MVQGQLSQRFDTVTGGLAIIFWCVMLALVAWTVSYIKQVLKNLAWELVFKWDAEIPWLFFNILLWSSAPGLLKFRAHQRDNSTTGFDLFMQRIIATYTPLSAATGMGFKPRSSDIFCCSYMSSGALWVAQICHQLRSNGSMDFADLAEIVPRDVLAHDAQQVLSDEQAAEPRLYYSVEPMSRIPKEAKYIYVVRNPRDALLQMWDNLQDFYSMPGGIKLKEFNDKIYTGDLSEEAGPLKYWSHLTSWLPKFSSPDTLVLFYEDMVEDLPAAVRRIQAFIGEPTKPESCDIAVEHSTLDFIEKHRTKFDEHFHRNTFKLQIFGANFHAITERATWADSNRLPKVDFTDKMLKGLDQRWRENIWDRFGIEDYAALRERYGAKAKR
eukprot:gnl/TRDRNA2_/TRDRNA2_186541_c0_seq1.p1 gnl/TRDRNA2_/TRDRNA2_186541_c0~~gnl/TRDRNA2_/TRDRNA2_186541_c0_seq1.p1  ORF type:complete len:384 (-),score=67.85 gnl/TRDRNA2_/TRDRNA2_186541_c0_seq1:122-1273(-)